MKRNLSTSTNVQDIEALKVEVGHLGSFSTVKVIGTIPSPNEGGNTHTVAFFVTDKTKLARMAVALRDGAAALEKMIRDIDTKCPVCIGSGDCQRCDGSGDRQ